MVMSAKPSSRLKAMCGFHSVAARRSSPRSSWTPSTCTSWPIERSAVTTSYSVRHGAAVMSVPSSIVSGGIRWRWTRASTRIFYFFSRRRRLQRHAMPPAVQVVHRLHREKDHEIDLGRFLRIREPQVLFPAALDDLLEQLIDRILIAVGEARDSAAHLSADLAHEA